MLWRFLLVVVCLAVARGAPDPSNVSPTPEDVATPRVQDVAAPKLQDLKAPSEEPEKGGPPPNAVVDEKKTDSSSGSEGPANAIVQAPSVPASEVGDMMIDPYHHGNQSSSDKGEEGEINNETVTVSDPHVNPMNKTHEEEGDTKTKDGATVEEVSSEKPTESSTLASSTLESSSVSPTESTTGKIREADRATQQPESEGNLLEDKSGKITTKTTITTTTTTTTTTTIAQAATPPVSALVSQHDSHDHPVINKGSSLNHTTQAAAILAGALVTIALLGYMGLLLWRRVLERRYGNREMLVNEDDDYKHFEL